MKVGIIQFDIKRGKVDANIKTAFSSIQTLGDKGADLVVLPELWSCGFDNKNLSEHAEKTSMIIEKLSRAASDKRMLIAGSLPEKSNEYVYNTMYLINQEGTVSGSYRKAHLFTFAGEEKYFGAGKTAEIYETHLGPIGMIICYDLRFPELSRTLVLKGAKIIIVSAQWPLARVVHWDTLLRARAIENQVFIVAANRCGCDQDLEFAGHSQIVSPFGNIVAIADEKPDKLLYDIDVEEIDAFRKSMPCLDERKPDVYNI